MWNVQFSYVMLMNIEVLSCKGPQDPKQGTSLRVHDTWSFIPKNVIEDKLLLF